MFPFESIAKLFSLNLDGKCCIEIEFSIEGYPKYQFCWMGKMPDKENTGKELYWYGLVPDGSEAYDYDNFQDFSSAPVFDGKSIKEIWNKVDLLSIDGCDPKDRLAVYLYYVPDQIDFVSKLQSLANENPEKNAICY